MKPWIRTALAVALVLAIAAGGFFLPNLVAARLDRADQDTAFSLSTGDEQGPATVLRRKLTDGMQNLFYGAEEPVELDESAAAHTLAEMTQYAQELLGALEKDSELFGGGFSVDIQDCVKSGDVYTVTAALIRDENESEPQAIFTAELVPNPREDNTVFIYSIRTVKQIS